MFRLLEIAVELFTVISELTVVSEIVADFFRLASTIALAESSSSLFRSLSELILELFRSIGLSEALFKPNSGLSFSKLLMFVVVDSVALLRVVSSVLFVSVLPNTFLETFGLAFTRPIIALFEEAVTFLMTLEEEAVGVIESAFKLVVAVSVTATSAISEVLNVMLVSISSVTETSDF